MDVYAQPSDRWGRGLSLLDCLREAQLYEEGPGDCEVGMAGVVVWGHYYEVIQVHHGVDAPELQHVYHGFSHALYVAARAP